MADDKDVDLTLDDQETPNEGLEAEADAAGADREDAADGAEGEGSAEGDGAELADGQEVEGEPRRPTRGEQRFQTLSRSAKEATERAAKAEARAAEMEARLARLEQPRQEQPRGKSPEELALMTPDELISYRLGESDKRFQSTLQQIQFATYEQGDKSAFEAMKASNPLARRVADKVETKLAEMRQQGQNVDRVRLAKFLIGEEVWEKNATAKAKQGADGQRRIQRQTTRPGSQQRSDTAPNRGKMSEAEAREKRLENMTF